jgi:hypothetical protein
MKSCPYFLPADSVIWRGLCVHRILPHVHTVCCCFDWQLWVAQYGIKFRDEGDTNLFLKVCDDIQYLMNSENDLTVAHTYTLGRYVKGKNLGFLSSRTFHYWEVDYIHRCSHNHTRTHFQRNFLELLCTGLVWECQLCHHRIYFDISNLMS